MMYQSIAVVWGRRWAATLLLISLAAGVSPTVCGQADGNTSLGEGALPADNGANNTALGYFSMNQNTEGFENTAVGSLSLSSNTTGRANAALGFLALEGNRDGSDNTATGTAALRSNTSGDANTAVGSSALNNNKTGQGNTAVGADTLYVNQTGVSNTAIGESALRANIASYNTAHGQAALRYNTVGEINTASGARALFSNSSGTHNAAHGAQALSFNTVGRNNTATGTFALLNNTTGDNNIGLGYLAGRNLTTGNNNIAIGAPGKAGEANAIRIGKAGVQKNTFIQGISGVTVADGVHVVINPAGKLGVATSSRELKENIKPMDEASEAIHSLKPVTFRYKKALDDEAIPQFGLIAEEVEKISPDLVARDENGKVFTVRYDAVNAMLLNEFLKEHRQVQEQQKQIAQMETALAAQKKQIEALSASVQKVTNRVELNNAQPQLAESTR